MAAAAPGTLNLDEVPAFGCRNIDCFEKLEQIGQGTYGMVYMAREIKTGEIVAMKKIRMENEKEGFPITAIREIKILKKLNHDNVIKLKEVVTSPGPEHDENGRVDGFKFKGGIYMVFEYMDHDLAGLSDRPGVKFTDGQIKCYMKQLLNGLHFCHMNQVLHRDIKGSNLLINNDGDLKLADFGLSRCFANDHNGNLTNHVITLWYRAPKLLLGATKYGPAVDMWSVGCIFAELLGRKPILPGKEELDQISKIFMLCGSPDESNWPGVSKLPLYDRLKPLRPIKRRVRETFQRLNNFDRHALDLIEKMLTLDPSQRICAEDALDSEYFWADPVPSDPKTLPKYESSHEFQTKRKRQQQRQHEENAKHQKHYHSQSHLRIPSIQQSGQGRPSQPMHPSQPPVVSGPNHHYVNAREGLNRYSQGGNTSGDYNSNRGGQAGGNTSGGYNSNRGGQAGGYSGGPYAASQGRGAPYDGGTGMRGAGHRERNGGYGVGNSNHAQQGRPYGGASAGGRDHNMHGNRNSQFGWPQ